ncbi:MAG: DUF1588 domain-containing protein [Planctomycetota bacterium]|nr:MAG: DUF1588 domain-containing protein [Planctomycetota bacterium]
MRHAHRLLFDVFLRHFTSQFLATSPGMVSASCVALALCHLAVAQDFEQGKALWATQCASCHGSTGQGVENHFADPLTGDLSIKELAEVIQATMPEGAPKSLTDPQAQALAQFVHHEFYSPYAQLRNSPPKIAFSRLTADQYRRSVSDLMAICNGQAQAWSQERGLQRLITQGEWNKDRKDVEKKVDGKLVWDWPENKPLGEVDHEKWQIRWSGTLLAPTSGRYEFLLDSTINTKLFVNDERTPLIDASVVSYEKSTNSASIFLVAGQVYRFVLDASKNKEPKARLSLQWKPPSGVLEPIPDSLLSPTWAPQTLLIETPFPPDDASVGYERGTSISRDWFEALIASAIEVGNQITEDPKRWMPKQANDPTNLEHVKKWCALWVSAALRRPLTPDDTQRFVEAHFDGESSIAVGIKKVCLMTLTSPEFQYPGFSGSEDEKNIARLALALWDSLPDPWMIELAAKQECHHPDQLRPIIDRMIRDRRFEQTLTRFYLEWLGLHSAKDLTKTKDRFDAFDESLQSDLRQSLQRMLSDYAKDDVDIRGLLNSDAIYLNGKLSSVFGGGLPPDAPFQKVAMPTERAAGVLSHPFVQAYYAYHDSGSPIHRGVFLARRVLGRSLRPPIDAIIPASEETDPGLTTRQRVAKQTSGAMCQSCHRIINPLGFAFENYDAIGRFRAEENGKPIDAAGAYVTSLGDQVEFNSSKQLGDFLAASPEVHQAIVKQLFQFFVKQPLPAYGLDQSDSLTKSLQNHGFKVRPLMQDIGLLICQPPSIPKPPANPAVANLENP